MDLFLTSQIGATAKKNGRRVVGKISNRYGFLSLFKKCLMATRQMLYISSTPAFDDKVSDWFHNTILALEKENIQFERSILVNGRNAAMLKDLVGQTDVIFLSGGHLPTQNQFFQEIGLREILKEFQGTIVAQSAGSMNCADMVYACPELPGESTDPDFRRFRPGLGLTNINIIPHYNDNRELILDGKRLYEDIIYPDTFQTPIYVIPDDSFIYIHNGIAKFMGEIHLYRNGTFEQVPGDMAMQDSADFDALQYM